MPIRCGNRLESSVSLRLHESYADRPHLAALFHSLWDGVAGRCRLASCRATKRYIGFYRDRAIFAYVDPQQDGLQIGVFAGLVERADTAGLSFCDFPDWNGTRGGLVGIWYPESDDRVTDLLAACYRQV